MQKIECVNEMNSTFSTLMFLVSRSCMIVVSSLKC